MPKCSHETRGPVNLEIVDPDPVIGAASGKKHAVRFEVSYHQWTSVALDDSELYRLGVAVENRLLKKGLLIR